MPSRTTQLITLTGPDAIAFANAQFGSALLGLAVGHWQWSAWLDPKGRVRTLLQVARLEDHRLVVVPRGGDASELARDLTRFVFRSKVTIAVSGIVHVTNGEPLDNMHALEVDGALVLGEGDASLRLLDQSTEHTADDAWLARHIDKGYAWLPDASLGTLLPPALSMERLGAVAFDKGCFPGQEIAARLHFLGGHKKHLHAVRADVALGEGAALRANDKDIGVVLMQHETPHDSTALVVLDDAVLQGATVETTHGRLHIISTFSA